MCECFCMCVCVHARPTCRGLSCRHGMLMIPCAHVCASTPDARTLQYTHKAHKPPAPSRPQTLTLTSTAVTNNTHLSTTTTSKSHAPSRPQTLTPMCCATPHVDAGQSDTLWAMALSLFFFMLLFASMYALSAWARGASVLEIISGCLRCSYFPRFWCRS